MVIWGPPLIVNREILEVWLSGYIAIMTITRMEPLFDKRTILSDDIG